MSEEKIEKAKKEAEIVKKATANRNDMMSKVPEVAEAFDTLLNYIDELQKEIEKLNYVIDKYGGLSQLEKYILDISKCLGDISIDCIPRNIKENYISKQKIKDKLLKRIEALDYHCSICEFTKVKEICNPRCTNQKLIQMINAIIQNDIM